MGSASFGKREREKQQRERAAAKRERRANRTPTDEPDAEPDAEALERFRLLSEAFASGAIGRDAYDAERREILSALGLGDAFDESP